MIKEVETCKIIHRNLQVVKLIQFFGHLGIKGNKETINSLIDKFGSLDEFVFQMKSAKNALEKASMLEIAGIGKNDAKRIVEQFADPDCDPAIRNLEHFGDHVVIDLEFLVDEPGFKDTIVVKSKRADCNLEQGFDRGAINFTNQEKLSIIEQVVKGIESVHAAGYIHTDPTPDNFLVFINNEGNGKRSVRIGLSDFGDARKSEPHEPVLEGVNQKKAQERDMAIVNNIIQRIRNTMK